LQPFMQHVFADQEESIAFTYVLSII
jgi:hypothetical protein